MIETYFDTIENTIRDFPHIQTYTLNKKIYSTKQGYVRGVIVFEDGCILEFVEVNDVEVSRKIKYRYHFMDKEKNMIFRYDNAFHHKNLHTYPHHKHVCGRDDVKESSGPSLSDVLLEISGLKFNK